MKRGSDESRCPFGIWTRVSGLGTVLVLAGFATVVAGERPIPGPSGPYVNLTAADFAQSRSFGASDRIVGTYYFYWYDAGSKSHIVNADGSDALTDHPPALEGFSYKSTAWHKRQLSDMEDAGVDVVLPVFWGAPSEQAEKAGLHWSYAGLKPLVEAREALLRERKHPPRIGLFYDTSTLQYNDWHEHIDLTTEFGRRWFYATVRDFFSMVPPKHWAMLDGRPIVLLYAAAFAKNHDQRFIDYTKDQFAREFAGRVPWIASEVSWQVKADSKVAWGGALGLKDPGVAALGPGYDHSAVPGRAPLVVNREGGRFYEENWLKLLRRPSHFVMVETWNEFHEGTDVCESKEYGRKYIDLTRKYADLFRLAKPPPWPKGKYSGARSVGVTLGLESQEKGVRQVDNDDGVTVSASIGGRDFRGLKPGDRKSRYLYFVVDDSFKTSGPMNVRLEVEYFDAAPGSWGVEFDGSDLSAPFGGAYTRALNRVTLSGDQRWKVASIALRGARFLHSENRNADLRLVVETPAFYVRRVTIER